MIVLTVSVTLGSAQTRSLTLGFTRGVMFCAYQADPR